MKSKIIVACDVSILVLLDSSFEHYENMEHLHNIMNNKFQSLFYWIVLSNALVVKVPVYGVFVAF